MAKDDFDPAEGTDELFEESPDSGAFSMPEPGPAVTHLAKEIAQAGPEATEQALMVAGMRSGPIPSAEELFRYNELGNNLGSRLGDDHLMQRSHERRVDRAQVKLAYRDADRADREQRTRSKSLIWTYIFMAFLFAGAFYLMRVGHPGLGVTLLSPTLIIVFANIIRDIIGAGKTENNPDK